MQRELVALELLGYITNNTTTTQAPIKGIKFVKGA